MAEKEFKIQNGLRVLEEAYLESSLDVGGLITSTGLNAGSGQVSAASFSGSGEFLTNVSAAEAQPLTPGTVYGWSNSSSQYFGYMANVNYTLGNYNTAVGYESMYDYAGGSYNTAIGAQTLTSGFGSYNTAVGFQAQAGLGGSCSAFGAYALGNTDHGGYGNTATGYESMRWTTSGIENTANGIQALYNNTTGSYNTATGAFSLYNNTTGNNNTATGSYTLYYNTTGSDNISSGFSSLWFNDSGSYNTAIGHYALFNSSGNGNTAMGRNSLRELQSGDNNTAIGDEALRMLQSGSNNTAVGHWAGSWEYNPQFLSGSNNTLLGYFAFPSGEYASDEVVLGNSDVQVLRCNVSSITSLSDSRDKKNIESLPIGLDFVNSLNPVKFDWNMRDGGKVDVPDTGFIAQDLISLEDETGIADYLKLTFRNNPNKLEASYGRLVPILVKAIQDLSAKVTILEERLNG